MHRISSPELVSWKNRKTWSQQVKPKPVCELSLSWGVHYPWSSFRPPTYLNLAECLATLLHFVEYSFAASTRPPSWLLCNLTVFDRVISRLKYDGCFEFARFLWDEVKSVPFECLCCRLGRCFVCLFLLYIFRKFTNVSGLIHFDYSTTLVRFPGLISYPDPSLIVSLVEVQSFILSAMQAYFGWAKPCSCS